MYKKIILIIIFLSLIVSPTKADAPTLSFYRPFLRNATGLAVYNDYWRPFTTASFDTHMHGLYTLSGAEFYTSYTGLVQITGSCRQDPAKVSDVGIRLVIDGYSAPVLVAKTSDEVFTFAFPFFAGDFQLQGFNYNVGRYDLLKCDILIEVVG